MIDQNRYSKRKRDEYYKKLNTMKRKKGIERKSKLRQQSRKQKRALKEYWPERAKYLLENPYCELCRELDGKTTDATEIHHKSGRRGKLLTDQDNFVSTCRAHREWPHQNPVEAARRGWMPESIAIRADYAEAIKKIARKKT